MEAFYNSALYRFYYPLLWRYARRLTGNQARAQQIALHVLWGHYLIYAASSWEGERKLLHTSVLNHCIAATAQEIFNRPAMTTIAEPGPGKSYSFHKPCINSLFL